MKKWRYLIPAAIGLAFGVAAGAHAQSGMQAVAVRAEGEESVSEPVQDEQPKESEVKKWAVKQYETFIVPILGTVSVASIASLLVTVVTTVIKNRRLNKSVKESQEKYAQCSEMYALCVKKLEEYSEIREICTKAMEAATKAKEATEAVSKSTPKIDNLAKMVALLAQLEAKVAKQSKEAIKSGIVEDVEELARLSKGL